MSKRVRVIWLSLTTLVLAPSIYVALRYFLGLDVTNFEILLVRVGFTVAFLLFAAFIFAWNRESVTELVPLAINALPRQLRPADVNYAFALPHDAVRRWFGRNRFWVVGFAAALILAITNPLWLYAKANSSEVVTVFYITNRDSFSNAPSTSNSVSYGTAKVLAPVGFGGYGIIYPLRRGNTPSYQLAQGSPVPLSESEFFNAVKASSKQELVFVHGFDTAFIPSLLRIGQVARDLKFRGAAIVFSWPAGNFYLKDKENAVSASDLLRQALYNLKTRTEPERVHVIAHSMGCFVLGLAFKALTLDQSAIDNVVLAAPDVDEVNFSQAAGALRRIARRVTIYVSEWDGALAASNIGQADRVGSRLVPRAGIDVVDTVDCDRPPDFFGVLGHSYLYNSDMVLHDLGSLINESQAPEQRIGTDPAGPAGCWRLEKRRSS
jgi:hypothetical protein